ncbi:hypothetical protein [Rhizobium ecuadorense]|uniref:hypothetical protein n=1 Tax=Rhizobium ecuadorense TaxID=1671795 RepID=UPI0006738972|nr:hypothetical protein [Rhizobium ecuadorense]
MSLETVYFFEELQIPSFGDGALFYGQAVLADNSGDTDAFVVTAIRLDSNWLERPNRDGAANLSQQLFKAISEVLYDEKTANGRHAQLEWSDAVSGEMPPIPLFKPRAGLLGLIVRGADMARERA